MTTNPSHILIARNSRGHNPSASLSSPTETHAAASGIFRSSGSPPWLLQECESEDIDSDDEEGDEAILLDETFTRTGIFPGTVKIIVETTTFWSANNLLLCTSTQGGSSLSIRAHKEVLFFASPFFEAALSGNWSETTGRPESISSIITISQPPSDPAKQEHEARTEMSFAPMDPDSGELEVVDIPDTDTKSGSEGSDTESLKRKERGDSLARLEAGYSQRGRNPSNSRKKKIPPAHATLICRKFQNGPDAVIVLKEERVWSSLASLVTWLTGNSQATTFHDFLKFVYPQYVPQLTAVACSGQCDYYSLECTITWNNVEGLMNISHKLCVPTLQTECLSFLLTHAAGRPIKAMRIAELFQEEDLYRESSRFVLDNPGGWSEHELNTLSQETLLKLEKR